MGLLHFNTFNNSNNYTWRDEEIKISTSDVGCRLLKEIFQVSVLIFPTIFRTVTPYILTQISVLSNPYIFKTGLLL